MMKVYCPIRARPYRVEIMNINAQYINELYKEARPEMPWLHAAVPLNIHGVYVYIYIPRCSKDTQFYVCVLKIQVFRMLNK